LLPSLSYLLLIATNIECNHPIVLGKHRDLLFPASTAGSQTVDEEKGLALSAHLIVDVNIIDA
jgi:hypothetical protein